MSNLYEILRTSVVRLSGRNDFIAQSRGSIHAQSPGTDSTCRNWKTGCNPNSVWIGSEILCITHLGSTGCVDSLRCYVSCHGCPRPEHHAHGATNVCGHQHSTAKLRASHERCSSCQQRSCLSWCADVHRRFCRRDYTYADWPRSSVGFSSLCIFLAAIERNVFLQDVLAGGKSCWKCDDCNRGHDSLPCSVRHSGRGQSCVYQGDSCESIRGDGHSLYWFCLGNLGSGSANSHPKWNLNCRRLLAIRLSNDCAHGRQVLVGDDRHWKSHEQSVRMDESRVSVVHCH